MPLPSDSYFPQSLAGALQITSGLFAAIPAPGIADRYYWATDQQMMYRDNGAAWQAVSHANIAGVTTGQHHAQVHGAADHTDVTRYLWLSCGDLAQGRSPYASVRLDNLLDFTVRVTFVLPSDLVSLTSFIPIVLFGSTGGGGGNLYQRQRVAFAAVGETYLTHDTTSAYAALAGIDNTIITGPDRVAYLAAATKLDFIGAEYERDATDLLDTFEANCWFLGWMLTYVAEQ